jgi:hypothetical protein
MLARLQQLLHHLVAPGLLGAGSAWLAARFYLCPPPPVHRPRHAAEWPLELPPPAGGGTGGGEELRCVQMNCWTGSTYELEPAGGSTLHHLFAGCFSSYETPAAAEVRAERLAAGLVALRPAVVCLNEAPSQAWVRRLADRLGYACVWHPGIAVVRLGPLALPLTAPGIEEGDAILWHPGLACEHTARRRLSGRVYGFRLALNLGDATQARPTRARRHRTPPLLVGFRRAGAALRERTARRARRRWGWCSGRRQGGGCWWWRRTGGHRQSRTAAGRPMSARCRLDGGGAGIALRSAPHPLCFI